MRDFGFELRVPDAADFVERTRVLPFVHRASGIPVDAVLAGPGIEDLFLQRAEQRTIENVCISVASVEDVVAMKILAGRTKDIEDVTAMLAVHADDIEVDLIRATLRLLEQALDQSDLTPRFDQLLRRVKRKR